MNKPKIKKQVFNVAWAILSTCVVIFFIVALSVYANVEPSGVSKLLPCDDTWYSIDELNVMSGDLEVYSYVTKVYEYATDRDSINIHWVNDDSVWRESIDYGINTDASAEHNYTVECFVYSDIADKKLIKRTWGCSVIEGDVLTFIESKAPYFNRRYQEIGDIKKERYSEECNYELCYYTFIRITVKPGFESVRLEIKNQNTVVTRLL